MFANTQHKRRRALALFLAAILVALPCAPLSAAVCAGGCDHVAAIGDNHFDTVQAAVEAAVNGDTVTVLKSHTLTVDSRDDCIIVDGYAGLINVADKTITLDLNGCTVHCDLLADIRKATNDVGLLALLSITASSNLTIIDSSSAGTGTLSMSTHANPAYALVSVYDSSSYLTIKNGRFICDAITHLGQSLFHVSANETTVIEGGYYFLENLGTPDNGKNGMPWIFNVNGQNTRHVTVTGGTFNADVNHQHWSYEVSLPVDKGMRNNGDGTCTVVDAAAHTIEIYSSSHQRGASYPTLEEAIAAVDAPRYGFVESVTLLTDCTVDETLNIDETFELNLDGHELIWAGSDTAPILTVAEERSLTVDPAFAVSREGHTFYGWYTDAACSVGNEADLTGGTVPAGTSLYAKWTPNSYTVTYVDGVDDEELFTDKAFTSFYGAATPAFGSDPQRPGYIFKGWSPAMSPTVTGDTVYTAQWAQVVPAGRANPSTGVH